VAVAALSRREQNKHDKRARITAAARALFAHKGFAATTTQEIADAAGVAAGTIFTYARTKDDLLILVFHDEMLDVVERARARALQQPRLLDQAIAFFDEIADYHERDRPLAHALMRQLSYVDSDDQRTLVSQLMRRLMGHLAKLIDAAKASGEVAASRPLTVAARTLFAVYFLHLNGLLNGYLDRAQFERALATDFALVLAGLAPARATKSKNR